MARATTFKYTVTVVNPGSGNKYYLDGILIPYITLFPGCTYEFNQDDSSNSGHPLRFATQVDAANSSEYTTGVTTSGTPGSATAWTKIEVTTSTPYRLFFYCTNHSGMGNSVTVPQGIATRAFSGGGYPSYSNSIEAIDLTTTGNSFDFGDMSASKYAVGAIGGTVKGLLFGGSPDGGSTNLNTIDQIIIRSLGNSTDFGDLVTATNYPCGLGNQTRGVYGGGYAGGYLNNIGYVTIAAGGNATDFGDLTLSRSASAGFSSSTRGVWAGGSPNTNIIDYVTIASTGNATDFGDLLAATSGTTGTSSSTRGIVAGGGTPSKINVIQYVTIASTGNSTDFGDLTVAKSHMTINGSNNTIGIFGGGQTPSASLVIDSITFVSLGNAQDFGDITSSNLAGAYGQCGNSNGHGGLQ